MWAGRCCWASVVALVGCNAETVRLGKEDGGAKVSAQGSVQELRATAGEAGRTKMTPRDFLFVVDNSSDGKEIVKTLRDALQALPAEAVLSSSRMAVMTTMVADYADVSKVHKGIRTSFSGSLGGVGKYEAASLEPGFLGLVDGAAVKKYLAASVLVSGNAAAEERYRHVFDIPLCDSPWFALADKNSAGASCISAALQTVGHPVGCEAGLNAFAQFVTAENKAGRKIFRDGIAAEVIFVSNEPHPGCSDGEIVERIPSVEALRSLVVGSGKAVSLRLHGIGIDPWKESAQPGDEKKYGTYATSVRQRVEESGGVYVFVKDITNYVRLLRNIFAGD